MFVDILLTSPERRQITLLSAIQRKQRIEFTELARELEWPYVSTQQVYRRIIANYETISGIKLKKADLLEQCDWVNLQLTKYLIEHSVGYQCLTAALHNQSKPVLNIGDQTVTSRLKPIAEWLTQRHISYDFQANELVGDERVIRLFGWQLYELTDTQIKLNQDELKNYKALEKLLPVNTIVTTKVKTFLSVTAIRITQQNMLSQENQESPMSGENELMVTSGLPAQVNEIRFNLVEAYWLQYMVTYSPYFVDTHKTKIVQPKQRAMLPYLIQLIVKAAVTRLRLYRSPLYFEELDEFLMESVQFALLIGQPVMHLDQEESDNSNEKLYDIISKLVDDIPELKDSVALICEVLQQETARFLPRQRIDIGYPSPFDEYTIGVLQQQLMTQFMTVDWHLASLPVMTEISTPTFRIVLQPNESVADQYYWLPWLGLSKNIQFLIQKLQIWLQKNMIIESTNLPTTIE